jgi:outer membrane receptor protein involved in Fe transport
MFTLGFAQNKGTIKGVIADKEMDNMGLPFATISIKGTNTGVNSDENGNYTFSVPAGSHMLVFAFLGYETIEVPVTIAAGETKIINQALASTSVEIEEVVIETTVSREKESALLLQQKNAVEIKQSIGAEEISRKGISDVEEGLTKITGVTKVESRGLFVRGLEDRYNNLLVNGFAVPSNSPFNKIVPLDLFPTDIVGYMDIYKTFNADIYGDFAGATVNINTSQPTQSRTKISIGAGYTTGNNLEKFLIASDANDAGSYFGFGGNDRDLSSFFRPTPASQTVPASQMNQVFKSGFNADETTSPLNTSLSITNSGRFDIGKNNNTLTYVFSTNYDNKFVKRSGVDRIFVQRQDEYDNDLRRTEYRFQTNNSTLLGLQYKTNRLKLNFNTLYLRSTENLIQDQIGYTALQVQEPNKVIRTNQFEQSDYLTVQLFGNYSLTEDERHSIKGGLSFTNTKFKQPDRKFIEGVKLNDTEYEFRYGGNNLLRQYLDINGDAFLSAMAEYNYKFGGEEGEEDPYRLTVGYNGYTSEIESTYRFIFGRPNNSPSPFTAPINTIDTYLQQGANAGSFQFQELSSDQYQNIIEQNVNAGYASFLAKLGSKLDLSVGIRAEQTNRVLKYREPGTGFSSALKKITKDDTDILPSLNAKYLLNDNSNLRFTFSKTITRPVLIETLPIQYVNADGTAEGGNEMLVNSTNYNVDLKYEVFPTNNELFAATVFAKYIDKPIERVQQGSGNGSGRIISYYNSQNATLLGLELEAIVQLSRIASSLEGFSFGINGSVMYTNVKVDQSIDGFIDTFTEERKLQGASAWMMNSDLKYEFDFSEKWHNTMSLVYNVSGKRIYAVGIAELDHIYENPFHKLDFVWSNKISDKWEVKFSADNILNPVYSQELGDNSKIEITKDRTLYDFKRGVGLSLNLSYTF